MEGAGTGDALTFMNALGVEPQKMDGFFHDEIAIAVAVTHR